MTMRGLTERHNLPAHVDAVVIGAGFGGMYMLYKLRQLDMSAIVIEAADDVGGTWYWNAYPGARCDVESLSYSYTFDSELREQWKWSERYSAQPEILNYARHVADKHDLRRDMVFGARVTTMTWADDATEWRIETDRGDRVSARYAITAVGSLSTVQTPCFPGLESFEGEWRHTGRYPRHGADLKGKRVALVGTGSSGIQAAPAMAKDAGHLYVLQRTAQFTVPAHNAPLEGAVLEQCLKSFEASKAMATMARAMPLGANPKTTFEYTPEEREAVLEAHWKRGGFGIFVAFKDSMTDLEANEVVAEFARRKIREIVKDPATAERLTPRGYPFGAKRLPIDSGYYALFNEPHVSLIDIKSDPIERITPTGIRLASAKEIEVDSIVFATGFDAVTGPLNAIDIRGSRGLSLREKWKSGARTYLGIASAGFPNLFMLTGPGSPGVLANVIRGIEQHANWLGDLFIAAKTRGSARIEADREFEDRWVEHVGEIADATLYPMADSWYVGANIPGKPRKFLLYVNGEAMYQAIIDEVAKKNYEGFHLQETSTGV